MPFDWCDCNNPDCGLNHGVDSYSDTAPTTNLEAERWIPLPDALSKGPVRFVTLEEIKPLIERGELPEPDVEVFAWSESGGLIYSARLTDRGDMMKPTGKYRFTPDYLNLTHWQPRPKAPVLNLKPHVEVPLKTKLEALVKAVVSLTVMRGNLVEDDAGVYPEPSVPLLREDVLNAVKGIDTCNEEPIKEWSDLCR